LSSVTSRRSSDERVAVHPLVRHQSAEQQQALRAGRGLHEPRERADAHGGRAGSGLHVGRVDDVGRLDGEQLARIAADQRDGRGEDDRRQQQRTPAGAQGLRHV
jgi:hypothetical protein